MLGNILILGGDSQLLYVMYNTYVHIYVYNILCLHYVCITDCNLFTNDLQNYVF